eukprot:scaffold3348_cov113-Isochrysis_galbana.AAC.9
MWLASIGSGEMLCRRRHPASGKQQQDSARGSVRNVRARTGGSGASQWSAHVCARGRCRPRRRLQRAATHAGLAAGSPRSRREQGPTCRPLVEPRSKLACRPIRAIGRRSGGGGRPRPTLW